MKSNFSRNLLLVLLVGLYATLSFFAPRMWTSLIEPAPYETAFLLGIFAGQPLLVAMWVALSTALLRVRLPAAVAATVTSLYAFIVGMRCVASRELEYRLGLVICGTAAILIIVNYFASLLLRATAGWRIPQPTDSAPDTPQSRRQYGLLDLIAWTAGIAIILGAGRWVLPTESHNQSDLYHGVLLYIFVYHAIGTGIVSLPALLAAGIVLSQRRKKIWLVAATLTAVAIFAGAAVFFGQGPKTEDILELLLYWLAFTAGLSGSVLGSLAIFVRLGRGKNRRPTAKSPPAASDPPSPPHDSPAPPPPTLIVRVQ